LRSLKRQQERCYVLRESYRDGDCWKYRDLMDLGTDPARYIEYPGGNGFYFHDALEATLQAQHVRYSTQDLENLFWPFLEPRIRRVLENFGGPPAAGARWRGCSPSELHRLQARLHPFDTRRVHYLRCGRVDIGTLAGRSWKFLNLLLEKSRDEIEHTIEGMEGGLRPHEIRPYLYTALELQGCFAHHLLRNEPAALDPKRVDESFLEAICRLNRDRHYFEGVSDHDGTCLHPYLQKYIVLYFDHPFAPYFLSERTFQAFVRQRRRYRPPEGAPRMPVEEACACLGITAERFQEMRRRELILCYRKKAKEYHPDAGGDHDAFIRVTRAFESLLARKR
jgi:hypothetical protein